MNKYVLALIFVATVAGPTWASEGLTDAQRDSIVGACNANHSMCTTTCSKGFTNALSDCQDKCENAHAKCLDGAYADAAPKGNDGNGKPKGPPKVNTGGVSNPGTGNTTGQAFGSTVQQKH